jgi:very-short-patch-repair endonuclease
LVRTRHGIYATKAAMEKAATTPALGHELAVRSAMLVVGDCVASHQSAAIIHGIDMLNDPKPGLVTLTRPRNQDRHGREDIAVHSGELASWQVMRLRTIRLTIIARTVVDLARTMTSFMEGVVVADAALRTRKVTPFEFEPILEACAGWRGQEQARNVIDFADVNAGSVFESCLRVLLRDWGFEPPETQVTIITGGSSFTVDFMYREQRTIIEADGKAKYTERKILLKQFERDRLLRDAGYKVVHVTWDEVFRQPQVVIDRIRRAFAVGGPFLGRDRKARRDLYVAYLMQAGAGQALDVDGARARVLAARHLGRGEMTAPGPQHPVPYVRALVAVAGLAGRPAPRDSPRVQPGGDLSDPHHGSARERLGGVRENPDLQADPAFVVDLGGTPGVVPVESLRDTERASGPEGGDELRDLAGRGVPDEVTRTLIRQEAARRRLDRYLPRRGV